MVTVCAFSCYLNMKRSISKVFRIPWSFCGQHGLYLRAMPNEVKGMMDELRLTGQHYYAHVCIENRTEVWSIHSKEKICIAY